ncbi:MAG: hypothetical protein FWG46_02070 [Treponema sp.]|nr:hypothetical protein [Treponema sp.]
MTNNHSEIVFDANSGISEEEQREILAKINGIAEKNRRSLASGAGESGEDGKPGRFKAQKSGNVFPMAVNIAALAALAAGLLILSAFHGKTDAQVRQGARVYNTAERALIDEIRKETSSRLEAKENEISLIATKLAEVDAELQELHSSSQELSAEQQAAEGRLMAIQEEYRAMLTNLRDERSQILEEARAREANLQAQLDTRTRELALSTAAVDLAIGEMDRLSKEQAQAAAVESQMGAFFAKLNEQIGNYHLDEAAETIVSMRGFLNTPSFQSLRSIQARKDLYTQAINSFETMVEEARRSQSGRSGLRDEAAELAITSLEERYARLERDMEEKDKTIAAFSSDGSALSQRLAGLEESAGTLRTQNAALEESAREKDGRIASLETNLAVQAQNAETSRQTVAGLQAENATLNQTITSRNATITNIQDIVQGRSIGDMTLNELTESLARIQQALGQ